MKRLLLTVLAALAGTLAVYAQAIWDLDIRAVLRPDGSARITQVWDVNVVRGTEWYIPIDNLGKMSVTDLSVSENGQPFVSEGNRWDVDRSLEEKTGRCGIVEKRNGVELCWGQGSYGPHVWTAEFTVHGLVQAFNDADGFNFMFVNPSLVAPRAARSGPMTTPSSGASAPTATSTSRTAPSCTSPWNRTPTGARPSSSPASRKGSSNPRSSAT